MNEIFLLVLSLSLSGALLTLLFLLLKPLVKNRVSKKIQYYICILVVIRFLLPFGPNTGLMGLIFNNATQYSAEPNIFKGAFGGWGGLTSEIMEEPSWQLKAEETSEVSPTDEKDVQGAALTWAWLVWLAPAAILLLKKTIGYFRFVNATQGMCIKCEQETIVRLYQKTAVKMGVKHPPQLAYLAQISTPMLVGVRRPVIIISDTELNESEMQYIFQHELTHFKRKDIVYKWLVQIAICLHWFNPFVYLMGREINKYCELSCDEAVLKNLNKQEKYSYGDILLKTISNNKEAFSTPAATLNKDSGMIKERLEAIMKYGNKPRYSIVFSAVIVVVILFGATLTGVHALGASKSQEASIQPKPIHEMIPSGQEKVKLYDYYRTYEEAHSDIEGGYVFYMNESFSVKAMPTVINDDTVNFVVNKATVLDVKIKFNHLFDGVGKDGWIPTSFVKVEILNPSGETAYSFYCEGREIEKLTDVTAEIPLYPGEWKYNVSFAYTSDGNEISNMMVTAKYRNIYPENTQWLLDNKL